MLGHVDTKLTLKRYCPCLLGKRQVCKISGKPIYATSLAYFKLGLVINV